MVDSKENYKFDLGVKGLNTPGWSFFFLQILMNVSKTSAEMELHAK